LVKGGGGHASMPHLAVDRVRVACEIGLALHAMVTRRADVFDPIVLTCGKIPKPIVTAVNGDCVGGASN
jgi:metal-dependent amidase/aminoacylase/carboxypeptidase family protein